ncbi:high-affinity branched-chain amino acid ABC transporter permease LivM [Pseudomonas sp. R5(2019)]|nr:high-affinity branched-chain amino acid ABC transporter permease LivM [Pseudomonas sp. R5(2019)]NBA94877.1 high-affinity branched-chain amino acid ABC transporter permease LivM [Pseudomonas sp. R5(2019)]
MRILQSNPGAALPGRLRDALKIALVGLVLGIPLIGINTQDFGGQLQLQTRWPLLAMVVAAVFVLRLLQTTLLGALQRKRASKPAPLPVARKPLPITLSLGWIAFAGALLLPILFSGDRYIVDIATTVLIYVMLGWGLNVVVGLAGLLDLGYVAFYAVGAYSYALLSQYLGLSFWACLPLAGALAASFGLLLGYPTLRLRGDYLAIVTLGFGEIIRLVLINWTELTGGPNGISSIARPSFFGLPFSSSTEQTIFASFFGLDYSNQHRIIFLYYLIFALAILTNVLVLRLRKLPAGRAWEAMREDEIACRALGINVTRVKLSAFALGAMLGGLAGVFFAARQGFISPESFTFNESAIVLAIVVLGGMGSQLGVVLAALVLVLLPELGRNFSEYRMLLFGAAMVLIMVWRPGGILSAREPSIRLIDYLKRRLARAPATWRLADE